MVAVCVAFRVEAGGSTTLRDITGEQMGFFAVAVVLSLPLLLKRARFTRYHTVDASIDLSHLPLSTLDWHLAADACVKYSARDHLAGVRWSAAGRFAAALQPASCQLTPGGHVARFARAAGVNGFAAGKRAQTGRSPCDCSARGPFCGFSHSPLVTLLLANLAFEL